MSPLIILSLLSNQVRSGHAKANAEQTVTVAATSGFITYAPCCGAVGVGLATAGMFWNTLTDTDMHCEARDAQGHCTEHVPHVPFKLDIMMMETLFNPVTYDITEQTATRLMEQRKLTAWINVDCVNWLNQNMALLTKPFGIPMISAKGGECKVDHVERYPNTITTYPLVATGPVRAFLNHHNWTRFAIIVYGAELQAYNQLRQSLANGPDSDIMQMSVEVGKMQIRLVMLETPHVMADILGLDPLEGSDGNTLPSACHGESYFHAEKIEEGSNHWRPQCVARWAETLRPLYDEGFTVFVTLGFSGSGAGHTLLAVAAELGLTRPGTAWLGDAADLCTTPATRESEWLGTHWTPDPNTTMPASLPLRRKGDINVTQIAQGWTCFKIQWHNGALYDRFKTFYQEQAQQHPKAWDHYHELGNPSQNLTSVVDFHKEWLDPDATPNEFMSYDFGTAAVDSVLTLLHALNRERAKGRNISDLTGNADWFQSLRTLDAPGVMSPIVYDPQTGVRKGRADVLNLQGQQLRVVGSYDPILNTIKQTAPEVGMTDVKDAPPTCQTDLGFQIDMEQLVCKKCVPGKFLNSDAKVCQLCEEGMFADKEGMTRCSVCQAGKFASSKGSPVCQSCPEGHACEAGATEPLPCNPGSFQGMGGSSQCQRCDKGKYQEEHGKGYCVACHETQTTQGRGSITFEDCGCPATYYLSGQYCQVCPEGLQCAGWGTEIVVLPGWYSKELPADPSVGAWKCTSSVVCVGQRNSSDAQCSPFSTGLNCGRCESGSSRTSDGTCDECMGQELTLLPLAVIIGVLLCGAFHYAWNHRTQEVELVESVLASVTVGNTLAFMLQIGIMHRLAITWPSEFDAVLSFASLFLFDLDVLKVGCIIPENFQSSYTLGFMMPSLIAAMFFVWSFLSRLVHAVRPSFPKFTWSSILNSIGMVMQALYISVVSSTISLFMCYKSGPEGDRALKMYPWELCFEVAWMSMLPFGILGLIFYVAGFFALLCWISYIAPRKWENENFRLQTRFLVFKYRTDKWWYGVLLLARSLMFALVPVVSPDDGYVQFFLLLMVLVGSVVLHLILLPYLDAYANNLETVELSLLVVILSVGSWFIEDRDYNGKDRGMWYLLTVILCISFVLCALALLGVFCYASFMILKPKLTREKQHQRIRKVLQECSDMYTVFLSLDDESKTKVFSEASYIDLKCIRHTANLFGVLVQGNLASHMSKQRLYDGSLSRSLKSGESLHFKSGESLDFKVGATVDLKSGESLNLQSGESRDIGISYHNGNRISAPIASADQEKSNDERVCEATIHII